MVGSDEAVDAVDVWSHRASSRSTWVVVSVSAGGKTGWGEVSDGGAPATLTDAVRSVARGLPGLPVREARRTVWNLLDNRRRSAGSPGAAFLWSTVLGGLGSALADLVARLDDEPLAVSLGLGPARPVRAYANLNRCFGGAGDDTVVNAAAAAAEAGFDAVKIAPFSGRTRPVDTAALRDGLSLTAAVGDALPSDVRLMVDCHHLVPTSCALDVARELLSMKVHWVEDLVDVTAPSALDQLASAGAPLAFGEHVWDPETVRTAVATGAVSFWLVDPKHAGGPTGVAEIAEAVRGTTLTFHNPSGPVGTAHAAQLASLAGPDTWLELAWGESARNGFLAPSESISDGVFTPTSGSGFGSVPRAVVPDRGRHAAPAVDAP